MPTRNVVLTDRNEAVIEALVGEGRYQNASEVLRDGLRLVEAREERRALGLARLRDAAAWGFDAVAAGDFHDFETMADFEAHIVALTEATVEPDARASL